MRNRPDPSPAQGLRATTAALSCLALWACATPATSTGPAAVPTPEGQRWTLVELQGAAVPAATPIARMPYVVLNDGRLAGSGGCNRVMATYQLDGSALRLGHGAGTRMMCAEGMELEQQFLVTFDKVAAWRPAGAGIEWLDGDGRTLATFSSSVREYKCDDGNDVLVRSGSGPGAGIVLSLKGKEYAMRPAPAASGARYVIEQGRRTDWSMEWHTKGNEALLLEAPLSHERRADDLKVFARCRAA